LQEFVVAPEFGQAGVFDDGDAVGVVAARRSDW
jgi:hypothetical protein